MYRVLIVDDEERICDLVVNLIPWNDLELEIAGIEHNGFDALRAVRTRKVDIIITDARMPGCDGIELIKQCCEQKYPIKYIIISGYRQFEYAHSALQYGVECYLLKPIDQDELIDSLIKCKERIKAKCEEEIEQKNAVEKNTEKMKRHFVTHYIFDGTKMAPREISSLNYINQEYQLHFDEGFYQTVVVNIYKTIENEILLDKTLEKIGVAVDECFSPVCCELIQAQMSTGIVIVLNYPSEKNKLIEDAISQFYQKLQKMIDVFDYLEISLCIGKAEEDICRFSNCVLTAMEALKYRIALKNKRIIYYDQHNFKNIILKDILTESRKEIFLNYFNMNAAGNCRKIITDCFSNIHSINNFNPAIVYDIADAVANLIFEFSENYLSDCEQITTFGTALFDKIYNASEETDIIHAIYRFVEDTSNYMFAELASENTKPIRLAKEYIDNHYMEQITLKVISDRIFLSSTYLSTVFRKETGVNFSEYLINKRMDVASELLRKTNYSLTEIAEKVGYVDVKYFSKLFNKVTGIKPSDFRKLYNV
jgi:Response regulator containing CheY-like receiver domain and AraC-type DNA-binding domain